MGDNITNYKIWMEHEEKCPHCGFDKDIRNPSGYCDHLHYPDYCAICKYRGYTY